MKYSQFPLIRSSRDCKNLPTNWISHLQKAQERIVICRQHVFLSDFVQNLDCCRQFECSTWVALIVETYCWNRSLMRPPSKLLTQHCAQQRRLRTWKKRDAYAGAVPLFWGSQLNCHFIDCALPQLRWHQHSAEHGGVLGLKILNFIKTWQSPRCCLFELISN